MNAQVAIAHYNQVTRQEGEYIEGGRGQMSQQAEGLLYTTTALNVVANGRHKGDDALVVPRPSHRLMKELFDDTRSGRGVKREEQALTFLREAVLPLSGVETQEDEPIEGILCHKRVDACSDAEDCFNDCLDQINTGCWAEQPRITIYHDTAGTPLALRKSEAVSSALTLQPVSFIGSEVSNTGFTAQNADVPAGSIVAVSNTMNNNQTGYAYISNGCLMETYLVDGPVTIRPVRLSPWAYEDALDRSCFAIWDSPDYEDEENHYGPEYDEDRGHIVETRTLDDFRNAAEQVMSMCGVAC